jgi:hypothetical protein
MEGCRCLDALAAAYAETGDFPAAVKWQTEAIQRHPIGRVPVLDNGRGFHGRLREYQRGQPTREYGSISVVVCFPTGETASSHLYSARGEVVHYCRVGIAHRREPPRPKTVGDSHPTMAHSAPRRVNTR